VIVRNPADRERGGKRKRTNSITSKREVIKKTFTFFVRKENLRVKKKGGDSNSTSIFNKISGGEWTLLNQSEKEE